ncbi:MocR-like pyridoxine biosynthesis transcription factor PdxR [Parafannyhessea umbonata]|uniref:MocR-like pyridoxine biosynthesis transcription factor PdxR n=1 Tax=Parafannyhessea umbonata TaxID=604330 RepID=UPI00359C82AA
MRSYDLSKRGDLPLYEYLYRCIRDDITAGAIGAKDRLPSRRALAERLGVSVVTVEGAYRQLVAEGYVEARPRSGFFVASLPSLPTGTAVTAPAVPSGREGPAAPAEAAPRPPRYDLSHGSTHASAGAARLWERSLRDALAHEPDSVLYQTPPSRGLPRLRQAIASHLERARGMTVEPERVVVAAGAQSIYAMLALYLRKSEVVAVEDPGYAPVAKTYAAAGLSVRHLPMDADGLSARALRASGARVAHVMPSHQFPTGRVMSVARRYELLGWAAEDASRLVVEDDFDCELRLSGRPVPALASMDATGSVMYLSTFSKSLASALRIAYLVLPPSLDADFDRELGFFSTTVPAIDQVTLARALESGAYASHVRRFRSQMRQVRDALVEGLAEGPAGSRLSVEQQDSGIHLVLAVGGRASEREVIAAARENGVALAPLSAFAHDRENSSSPDGAARFVVQYEGLSVQDAHDAAASLARAVLALP